MGRSKKQRRLAHRKTALYAQRCLAAAPRTARMSLCDRRAALERKAELYERLRSGEIMDGQGTEASARYNVDFVMKGHAGAHGEERGGSEVAEWARGEVGGTAVGGVEESERERERRAYSRVGVDGKAGLGSAAEGRGWEERGEWEVRRAREERSALLLAIDILHFHRHSRGPWLFFSHGSTPRGLPSQREVAREAREAEERRRRVELVREVERETAAGKEDAEEKRRRASEQKDRRREALKRMFVEKRVAQVGPCPVCGGCRVCRGYPVCGGCH